MTDGWYTERWDRNGREAKSHVTLDSFDAVREALRETLAADQLFRVRAPLDADRKYIEELLRLGAEPI